MTTFGEKLRAAREAAGLTPAELGRRAGLDETAVSRLESGDRKRPYLDTAQLLAEALGVPLGDLLPEVTLPEPQPVRPRGRPRKPQPAE